MVSVFGGVSGHLDNINTSKSISAGESQEESNLIIYILGLILLIVWKITMIWQVRLHWKHNRLGKLVGRISSETATVRKVRGPPKAKYKTKYSNFLLSVWYSQPSSMVNVFGDSVASGP